MPSASHCLRDFHSTGFDYGVRPYVRLRLAELTAIAVKTHCQVYMSDVPEHHAILRTLYLDT